MVVSKPHRRAASLGCGVSSPDLTKPETAKLRDLRSGPSAGMQTALSGGPYRSSIQYARSSVRGRAAERGRLAGGTSLRRRGSPMSGRALKSNTDRQSGSTYRNEYLKLTNHGTAPRNNVFVSFEPVGKDEVTWLQLPLSTSLVSAAQVRCIVTFTDDRGDWTNLATLRLP